MSTDEAPAAEEPIYAAFVELLRCVPDKASRSALKHRLWPILNAAQDLRSCFGTAGSSLYLMKSGTEMEKATAAYDEAVKKAGEA